MSGNLLEMVHKHVDRTTVDTIASLLSQSGETMHSAIDQVIPTLAGGLAQKSSTREGARELNESLDRVDDSILDDIPGYLSSNTSHVTQAGTGILGNIFGADLGNVLARLAPSTGLGEAGTSSVMKMVAPIVLAVLSRHRRRERLDADGLAQFLDDQRRDVDAALPSSMAGLFGMSPGRSGELGERIGEDRERADRYDPGGAGGFPTGAAAADDTRPGGQPVAEAEGMHPRHGGGGPSALHREQLGPVRGGPRPRGERSMGLRWLVPLLGLLAMVALVYGLLRHRQGDGVDTIDPSVHGVQERPGSEGQEETPPPRLEPREQPAEPEGTEGTSPGEPGTPADGRSAPAPEDSQGPQGMAPGAPNDAVEPGSAVEGRVGAVTGRRAADSWEGAENDGAMTVAPPQGALNEALGDDPVHLGTLFGAGSSELEAGPGNRLNTLLQLVQDNSERLVEIRGYAFGADTGDTRELAQSRAEAVRDWLIDNGVDPSRIEAVGGGTSSRSQIDVFLR